MEEKLHLTLGEFLRSLDQEAEVSPPEFTATNEAGEFAGTLELGLSEMDCTTGRIIVYFKHIPLRPTYEPLKVSFDSTEPETVNRVVRILLSHLR